MPNAWWEQETARLMMWKWHYNKAKPELLVVSPVVPCSSKCSCSFNVDRSHDVLVYGIQLWVTSAARYHVVFFRFPCVYLVNLKGKGRCLLCSLKVY